MVLNMVIEQAIEDQLLLRNPLHSRSVRIKGRASKPRETYTVEQMQYIVSRLDMVANECDRAYLALHALHPLRPEEVLGLKFEDLDTVNMIVHIRRSVTHPERNQPVVKDTKTEASVRDIDLVPQIIKYIPMGKPDQFVIGGDKPVSYQQVKRMCNRIRRDIGFEENITPSRFRTTVLTDLYEATKDIKQVQAAAGHTTAAMTLKHYVKGRGESKNSAAPVAGTYGLTS